MKILLAGPPACGKGTVGERLSDQFKIPSISMGQTLRDLPETHPRYLESKEIMESGGLAPDDLVADLMRKRLEREDCKNGYILDGYGRSLGQIELFEPPLDVVVLLDIPVEETLRRITGRRTCDTDGKIYNIYTIPKEELAKCEGNLVQRDDDTEEAVLTRIEKYKKETLPVLDYFKTKGMVKEVSGMGTVSEEYAAVLSVLEPFM